MLVGTLLIKEVFDNGKEEMEETMKMTCQREQNLVYEQQQ